MGWWLVVGSTPLTNDPFVLPLVTWCHLSYQYLHSAFCKDGLFVDIRISGYRSVTNIIEVDSFKLVSSLFINIAVGIVPFILSTSDKEHITVVQ